jgi:hypothetical protein
MNSEMTMNTEQSEKDELGAVYYDFYKEVHGIRPRWVNHDEATVEWYRAQLEQLQLQADINYQEQLVREGEAIAQFEKSIDSLIASGAGDRATAIRWMHEANDTNYDSEYLCYLLDLPYGYFRKEEVQ